MPPLLLLLLLLPVNIYMRCGKMSTPPGMRVSPTSMSMAAAAAAAQNPSAFGPPPPPAATATTEGGAAVASARDGALPSAKTHETLPLGNPQFQDTWEDNGKSHGFRVRGPGYLSGGGKVAAGAPFGELVRADLYKVRGRAAGAKSTLGNRGTD